MYLYISQPNTTHPTTGPSICERSEMYNVKTTTNFNIERKQHRKPRMIYPEDYENKQELFQAIETWWTKRYRKQKDSWHKYRNDLKKMSNHELYPIDLFNPQPDQIIAHLDYIEDEIHKQQKNEHDETGIYQVIKRWKAIKALMRAYGRLDETTTWNYTPPPAPAARPRIIPSVPTVHNIIHHKYSTDPYENKLFQYLGLFSFFVGFRTASEISILKTTDLDLDSGILTFYQPKVHAYRTVALPSRLVDSKNTKNLKSWIDSWRPKVTTSETQDIMFPQPNGRPYTEAYLTKKLREKIIPVWNNYYPYSSRHWYATGKLVLTKVNNGSYDLKEVCDDMHHSSTKVTERYTRTANKWYNIQPFDWFNTLLKLTRKRAIKECKISTFGLKGGTDRNPSENEVWARPGRNLIYGKIKSVYFACKHVLKKLSISSSFFSFQLLTPDMNGYFFSSFASLLRPVYPFISLSSVNSNSCESFFLNNISLHHLQDEDSQDYMMDQRSHNDGFSWVKITPFLKNIVGPSSPNMEVAM